MPYSRLLYFYNTAHQVRYFVLAGNRKYIIGYVTYQHIHVIVQYVCSDCRTLNVILPCIYYIIAKRSISECQWPDSPCRIVKSPGFRNGYWLLAIIYQKRCFFYCQGTVYTIGYDLKNSRHIAAICYILWLA